MQILYQKEKETKMNQNHTSNQSPSLRGYVGAIPEILGYQLITRLTLFVCVSVMSRIGGALLWIAKRPAFTSGDLPYLMRTWQGWCLLLVGLAILVLYTLFDVNAMIVISSSILHQKKVRISEVMREAFRAMKFFGRPRAILVLLYIAFIAPLTGVAVGISLTKDFYIPDFIMSVIRSNFLYHAAYGVLMLALLVTGLWYIFTFHFVLIGRCHLDDAMKKSKELFRRNWKDFLWKMICFGAVVLLMTAAIVLLFLVLPYMAVESFVKNAALYRYFSVAIALLFLLAASAYGAVLQPFTFMKLTLLYESYTEEDEGAVLYPKPRLHWGFRVLALVCVVLVFAVSIPVSHYFDQIVPAVSDTEIIAHRGAGVLEAENSARSVAVAAKYGAAASETDVQRTADGRYIINHDKTFQRLCGVNKTPMEMTAEEISKLSIHSMADAGVEPAPVATLEDMLEAAKENEIRLYIELKGKSADRQMADDVYAIVAAHGMLDQCTFICLDYGVIDYFETKHPDAHTGYLCYYSFGKLQDLNCDMLILEEETATAQNIRRVHNAGKKAAVWTCNSVDSINRFLNSEADGIITDEVKTAHDIKSLMSRRNDIIRTIEWFLTGV